MNRALILLGLVLLVATVAIAQSPSSSSQMLPSDSKPPTASGSMNGGNATNANNGTKTFTEHFVCRKVNQYNLTQWVPLNNFLSMDKGVPAQWTVVNRRTVHVDAKDNARPTALLSPEVWTGRVNFTGYMTTAKNATRTSRRIGFLFGVVSPRTRFLLLEWANDDYSHSTSSCVTPIVPTAWNLEQRGLAIKAYRNPLGQNELQQECYLYTPIAQTNVTSIIYSNNTIKPRTLGINYWFSLIMDTYANSIQFVIRSGGPNGTVIAQNTTFVQNHDLSGNFSLGRVGFWVAGGQATFWNLTVTPETCENDPQTNCGYNCKEDPNYYYPDNKSSGLAWWAILLIILAICICCCLICVIILAIIVLIKKLKS